MNHYWEKGETRGDVKKREEDVDRRFKEMNERLEEDLKKSKDPVYQDQQKNKKK
jgi:hypothetical protein